MKNIDEMTGDTDYSGWSYWGSDLFTGRWTHFFRKREALRVPASAGWTPQDEERRRRPVTH